MYRLAMSIVCDQEDAADAAQEAVCTAYQKLDTLHRKERFKPWLLRILANECYGILRQRQRFVESDAIPASDSPGPEAETSSDLWQAVQDLNEQYRSVVVLYYYEGFTTREIAVILKISESNVKTRLSRARKRLRDMLEDVL